MTTEQRDGKVIWHPYTQHKTAPPPLEVVGGEGAYLQLGDGRRIFDGISSWWVNLHGHAHPYLAEKLAEQARRLEHVIFADFTHRGAVELAERVLGILPGFSKVFYSDNGSTAVEVALKMAVQFYANRGEKRHRFISFKGAYHGDTFGAMAISERGGFTRPFWPMLFPVDFIDPEVDQLEQLLKTREDVAGFIFEPLVQGASGMKMHDLRSLEKLIALCRAQGILTIADEVMTGFGRTGKLFAIDHLREKPHIICLSKGLTGGAMPLAMTACAEEVYHEFYRDEKSKAFFHGHSFTANPLGCAVALASLDLLERPECAKAIASIEASHREFQKRIAPREVRVRGTIMAMELETPRDESGYFNPIRDRAYEFFISRGVLLRPLGNVLYMIPPYCSTGEDLERGYKAIEDFITLMIKDHGIS